MNQCENAGPPKISHRQLALCGFVKANPMVSSWEIRNAFGMKDGSHFREMMRGLIDLGLVYVVGYGRAGGAGGWSPYYAPGLPPGDEPKALRKGYVTVGYEECVVRARKMAAESETASRLRLMMRGVRRMTEFAGGRNPWLK